MTELRKALERPVAGLVFDENRKNAVREKAFTAKRVGSALRRGAAAALVCAALCATAVAAILGGYVDHRVTVHLLGGDLQISWSGKAEDSVMMTGPATTVFSGKIDL